MQQNATESVQMPLSLLRLTFPGIALNPETPPLFRTRQMSTRLASESLNASMIPCLLRTLEMRTRLPGYDKSFIRSYFNH
jgi:hypothetical protein